MKRHDFGRYRDWLLRTVTSLLIFLTASQLRPQSIDHPADFPDLAHLDHKIVARIGNKALTAKEFLLSYEFGPAFLKRKPDSKKKYLDLMIYEKLLANYGYQQGFEQKDAVIRSCRAYAEDIITEELFREAVMTHVSVSDQEIEDALPAEQRKITIRWLFTKNRDEILEKWYALKGETDFDSLYHMQLNDTVKADDRYMQTTFYRLKIKNPALAAIIDTVTSGNFTNPISVPDGWYIVKIDSIYTALITNETEYHKLTHELERSIYKQKLDNMSDAYVSDLMAYHAPEIDRSVFRQVVYYINDAARYPDPFAREALDLHLPGVLSSNPDPAEQPSGNSVLVYGKSVQISLDAFIDWYRPRMAYLKFSQKSETAFILAVQRTVWRMVRDVLLVQKARELNLDEQESVRQQIAWWQDKIVYNAVKSEIRSSIEVTEKELLDYFHANPGDYRYSDGESIPFETARENVESDYIREKYMSALMRRILNLKTLYGVHINEQVLAEIEVQDEEDPLAIDFYAVKKGGLIPRQPYPTIDWDWQLWY